MLTMLKWSMERVCVTNADRAVPIDEQGVSPKPVVHEEKSHTKTSLGDTQDSGGSVQRILGVQWNFVEDKLVFDLRTKAKLASENTPTYRNIAAIVAKFYDPIGFLSPVIIQFKLLFQEASWDDTLKGHLNLK